MRSCAIDPGRLRSAGSATPTTCRTPPSASPTAGSIGSRSRPWKGPSAMEAVVAAAAEHRVGIHRISQGSGIMLLTDDEITAMLALGRAHGIEVCLFVGPRATWDTGVQAASLNGRILGCSLRGADQLAYGIEDVLRGAALACARSSSATSGSCMVLGQMKKRGRPARRLRAQDLGHAGRGQSGHRAVLEDLGATSINLPVDLSPGRRSRPMRQAIDAAIDFYVEGPDDFGGTVRHYEIRRARAGRRAHLPEVRPPQLARALSERPASGGHGAGAVARARAPGRASAWRSSPATRRTRWPRRPSARDAPRWGGRAPDSPPRRPVARRSWTSGTTVVGTPWRELVFLELDTDTGLVGVGEVRMVSRTDTLMACIHELGPRHVIGTRSVRRRAAGLEHPARRIRPAGRSLAVGARRLRRRLLGPDGPDPRRAGVEAARRQLPRSRAGVRERLVSGGARAGDDRAPGARRGRRGATAA